MAILGNLIKAAINVSATLSDFESESHDEAQRSVLKDLLQKAKDTAFGKFYGFEELAERDDVASRFAQLVPIHSYDKIAERWWNQQQKFPDITWPGKPDYFALSSGTTGSTSKRIPVTDEMIQHTKNVGVDLMKALHRFELDPEIFEKEVLMLSSSSDLQQNENGFLEGEISGINTYNFPDWYDWFYRPGKEIASISDWDERLKAIVKAAPDWDISVIAGIPSWVQLMLKAIIKEYDLETIHDLWPHLTIYNTGGVAFGPFEQGFSEITARPLTIIDTYLASEGFFGFTDRPNTRDMRLVVNGGVYYEFIPFNDEGFRNGQIREDAPVLGLAELEEDTDYAMLISTCSGAWRYMIGDTVSFSDLSQLQFRITGRTKFFLNVVGSQLSEEKLNAAIEAMSEEFSGSIDQFSVACVQEGEDYYHQWVVASDTDLDEGSASDFIDGFLKDHNKNYGVARTKALAGVKVRVVNEEQWYQLMESEKKKGGQVKTPKVVDEETMNRYIDFFQ
jgi:hypothetical protein